MQKLHEIHPAKSVSVYSINEEKETERMIFNNRNEQSFTTLQWGASDIVLEIPYKFVLLGQIFIDLELQNNGTYTGPIGLNAIKQIRYQLNGSTVMQLQGDQHALRVLNQCESKSKRDAVIRAAGGPGVGQVLAANKHVLVPLALPWSHIKRLVNYKPLDINSMGGNVRVFVSLREKTECYTVVPTQDNLASASFKWRQGKFMNMKDYMLFTGGNRFLRYPMSQWQARQVNYTGSLTGTTITLNGFKNGMCKSIYLMNVLQTDINTNKNRFAYEQLQDIRLELNGETLFRTDDNQYEISSLFHTSVPDEVEQPTGTIRPFYNLQISQFNSKETPNYKSNSGRNFSGQDLQLNIKNLTANAYTMFLCYVYDGLIVADGSSAQIFL
jgi:hypothetical protein